MKTLRIMALLSLAAAALSCQKEQHPRVSPEIYHKSDVEVKATAALPEGWTPMTKAVSDITDIDNSELQSRGFGVYAFYTGEEEYSAAADSSSYEKFGLVLNNRRFSYSGGAWDNTGKAEFWPTTAGENLSLFAYAPWDTWNSVVEYDGKVPSIVYDSYVAQNLSVSELSKQRDLLWGTNTSGNPHKNVEKDDYDPEGTVDFHFRHAVAKVHFNVKGTLPGEVRNMTSGGTTTTTNGTAGASENGEISSVITGPVFVAGTRYTNGTGNRRNYYATLTETETESYIQTQFRTNVQTSTNARYAVDGQRYLIEEVTFQGFNKTGTLVLDNSTAYTPSWTGVTRFPGPGPEYVLNSGNVLSQSLQYVSAASVQDNFSTYTGITEDASDLMGGYFLYAIPRESSAGDRITATIKYHRLNVSGNSTATQNREIVQYRTRTITRNRTRSKESEPVSVNRSGTYGNYRWDYPTTQSSYTFTADYSDWGDWTTWSPNPTGNSSWGEWQTYSEGDWEITSETPLPGIIVNYNDDPAPHLSGEIITSLQGGREYDINLIVAGDKIELDVVPKPWELKDFEFDYNANINDVITALTYDSSFIDYAEGENVYINNRMGKFYFSLGSGKYASWQASLVGDAAFGFTDENGNFLLDDHGNRVSSIRNAIEPGVLNYIYIKPINTEATVTSHAKLRIYYIDATGDAVVALNLVNMDGVTEWTIWQNAN